MHEEAGLAYWLQSQTDNSGAQSSGGIGGLTEMTKQETREARFLVSVDMIWSPLSKPYHLLWYRAPHDCELAEKAAELIGQITENGLEVLRRS